jgi:hypothetical protein
VSVINFGEKMFGPSIAGMKMRKSRKLFGKGKEVVL